MRRGEEDQGWSRVSARAEERVQLGFDSMQTGKSPLGPSRFQASSSQRIKPLPRKPPEPLRRAVASCLSATYHSSSEAVRTLQDYLSNPSTADLVYTVLLEHANAERDRSPPVVARCVSLLKRYLLRYVPKPAMLQQVDAFCAILIAECSSTNKASMASPSLQVANESPSFRQTGSTCMSSLSQGTAKTAFASGALVKSLIYVRALVARHLPSNLLQSTRIAEMSNAHSKRSRTFHTPYGPSGNRGSSDDKDPGKTAIMQGLEENEDLISTDLLKWRWMGGKRQLCWTPSPVMTDSGGIARPQVKRLYEFSDMGAATLFLRGNDFKVQRQHGKSSDKKPNLDSISDQLLEPSKVTTVTDNGSTQSHLRAIAALKRQKYQSHQVWDSDVPKSTWRRRLRPLFQYKHYSEQQPLRLSNAEIEEVISAFCVEGAVVGGNTPGIVPLLPAVQSGRLSVETADIAGSVLIKLIIDMYMADPHTASPLTLSMLEGMLSSPTIAVRIRCFDLLLNLGIHAHLLEPMQIEDQSSLEEEAMEAPAHLGNVAPFLSSKRGLNLEEAFRAEERFELMRPQEESGTYKAPVNKVDGGTPEAVKLFEVWILQILFEMLLFLVQMREIEEKVWVAALSCLLYFVCDRGRIQRQRLCGIDIRVLKILLNVSWENAWAEELHCTLVCMMSNSLYKVSGPVDGGAGRKAVFDMEQLELLGGIEFICVEYARAKSVEEKANLFSVVTDYVLHKLNTKLTLSGKSCPGVDDIQAVIAALSLGDAAEAMGFAFKHGFKNVGEGLFKSIIAAMSRDVDSGRLNSGLLEEMTAMFDALVANYTHPDKEFAELISITMASEGLSTIHNDPAVDCSVDPNTVSQAWDTLNALLHSSKLSCRSHGYSWLVDLLSCELTHDSISMLDVGLQQQPFNLSRSRETSVSNEMIDMNSSHMHLAVRLFYGLLRSRHASVRRGFTLVLERLLVKCQQTAINSSSVQLSEGEVQQDEDKSMAAEKWENTILELMNGALWQFVSANDTNHINILQMCDVMFSQLCIIVPSSSLPGNPSNTFMRDNMVFNRFGSHSNLSGRVFSYLLDTGKGDNKQFRNETKEFSGFIPSCTNWNQIPRSSSVAAMLLKGQAAAPRVLVASMPTDLLYWPLLQLAGAATEDVALGVAVGSQGRGRTPGGASDVRAALLVLLIGKCSVQQSAFEEVGGEEFFRSLLDDMDARVAYYTASFLLKRMMSKEPERYQRVLHTLVFRAQQCNNEKLLENPYLQMRGILQLSTDLGSHLSFQET